MGFFWWSKPSSNDSSTGKNGSIDIPKELDDYISGKKDTSFGTKDFKKFLKENWTDHAVNSDIHEDVSRKSVSKLGNQSPDDGHDVSRDPSTLKHAFKTNYSTTDTEIYKRENGLKESVLTNCSEIQFKLLECLKRKSTMQKITGYVKGDDECSMLADFLSSCTKLQKMALIMFDYGSLDKVEEMEMARASVDKVFNNSFKTIKDIEDNKKYMEYTRSLKNERDRFHSMFGK